MNSEKPRRVVLVTGGSRGIGAAISRRALLDGFSVCVNYRSDAQAAELLVQELRLAGAEAAAIQADVSDPDECKRLAAECEQALGSLDALVNNAGIVATAGRFDEFSPSRLQRMMAVNVLGPMYMAQEAVRRMSTRHGGSGGVIVNISSIAARLGSPFEYIDYASSKAAIDTFTLGLAKEVAAEGIRVNAVSPGLIDTDLHAESGDRQRPFRLQENIPMKRVGTPDEVADAVVFLLSNRANYITGANLNVSGGR